MGEHEKIAEDGPYTHSEIQRLLVHSSVRNRVMILLEFRRPANGGPSHIAY